MSDFTPAVIREDGKGRVAHTAGQVGAASALVIVGEFFAIEIGWDGELPTAVSAAIVTLLGTGASWWTNRKRLRGES
jgi:hypothetical protein